jgi:hypothetical protein
MDELPGVCDGVAAATFRVFNPTAKAVTVDCLAEYSQLKSATDLHDTAGMKALLTERGSLEVPAGKSAELRVNKPLPEVPGKQPCLMRLRVTQGQAELFGTFDPDQGPGQACPGPSRLPRVPAAVRHVEGPGNRRPGRRPGLCCPSGRGRISSECAT